MNMNGHTNVRVKKERKWENITLHTLVLSFDYIEQIFMTDIILFLLTGMKNVLMYPYKYTLNYSIADWRYYQQINNSLRL